MGSRSADGPLVVKVPGPMQDRPSWKAVAIIAAVGFVVGILWPRLAGVRLGPSLPEVSTPAGTGSSSVRLTGTGVIAERSGYGLRPRERRDDEARGSANRPYISDRLCFDAL
jgi:hypothetical protein